MKKVIKSIFIFLLLSIIVNVKAINVGDKFTMASSSKGISHSASYQFGYSYQTHTVSDGSKTYDAYCMDRGKSDNVNSLVVNRLIPTLKGDYAVLYILQNGQDYEQKHLAIRTLVSKGILNWENRYGLDALALEYLAKIDEKVNCMKSDSTFNSTLTEFLSNTSKKSNDNDENADEGGKSLALLGFEKYNLLEGKCKYTTAAQCADATGKGCHLDSNNCYIPSTSSTDICPTIKDKVFECYTGRFQSTEKLGCKIVDTCSFNTAAECSAKAGLKCRKRDGKWYQLNWEPCDKCTPNEYQGIICPDDERDPNTGCKKSKYACTDTEDDLSQKNCESIANNRNNNDPKGEYHDWVCTKKTGSICYRLERKGSSSSSNVCSGNSSEVKSCCEKKNLYFPQSDCEIARSKTTNSSSKKCELYNGCYRIVDKKTNPSCDGSKGEYRQDICFKRKKNNQDCKELDNGCYKLVNISAKCDESKDEYIKDQCEGIKKTKKIKEKVDGSCVIQNNGCYKFVVDSNGNGSGGSVSCGGFDGIKQLLIDAMNYANEKFGNDGGESKVEKGPATDPEKADGVIKKIVSVKIDIKNITDSSSDEEYFKYLGFEVEKATDAINVKLLGTSTEFLQTEEGWVPLSEGEDLSDRLGDEKNGTLYVGFLVWRDSSDDSQEVTDDDSEEEDCEVKIKFKYEYSNEKGGVVLHPTSQADAMQRFFVETNGEPIKDEFELDTSLCDETTCDPTSTLPNICEDGLEPDEETGNVEYEFREAYNAESKKYNIKKCLLSKNSKDKAGNFYKLVDTEFANKVAENDYCEVKCKEDYIFGVPYKKSTESGRYFQISVSLKGQQDCYTTKLDYKKYTEDIVKKQAEILDTYNEWLENYENYTFSLVQGDAVACNANSCPAITDQNGNSTGKCTEAGYNGAYDYKKMIDHSKNFYTYEIKEESDKWTIINVKTGGDAPHGNPQFGEWTNTKRCQACELTGECEWKIKPEKDYADKKEGYKTAALATKDKLKDKMKELREIIDNYNSCVADHDYPNLQLAKDVNMGLDRDEENKIAFWDMVYKYNPSIQYSYREPEPGVSSTKWISSVQAKSCEHGMNCDFMYSPDAIIVADNYAVEKMVEAGLCVKYNPDEKTSNGSKPYCMSSDSIKDIDEGDHHATWYCDGTIDNEYEICTGDNSLQYQSEYQWTVLDEDLDKGIEEIVNIGNNLTNSEHLIAKADYVHKIASSRGTYKTERVYYSGHDDGDIKIEETPEHEIKNYDIVDGLPVGINTPTGTYYYKLALDNFGTFYTPSDAPQVNGRIYGTLDRSLSSKIRGEEQTKGGELNTSETIGSNEYACTYEVNQNFCTDAAGIKHYKTECDPKDDWDTCQAKICPATQGGPYCVEKAEQYYKCSNTYYDESCESVGSGTREETLLAVGCQPGEECENNYNCCPNCTVQCIGVCTVTPDGSQGGGSKPNYDFRPISPGNLFPNDRPKGYNWESDPSVYNNSLVARKAKDTIDEITARANDTTSEETTPSSGNPKVENYSLKVVMNSDMITNIREYNKSQESYNNDTMTCYDYQIDRDEDHCKNDGYSWKKEGDSGKCVMANIFCYSSFIDDLADGKFGGEVDIKNGDGRKKNKENLNPYRPNVNIENFNTDNLIVTNDYWTIYTFSTLDINGDGIPDVGPSWK